MTREAIRASRVTLRAGGELEVDEEEVLDFLCDEEEEEEEGTQRDSSLVSSLKIGSIVWLGREGGRWRGLS